MAKNGLTTVTVTSHVMISSRGTPFLAKWLQPNLRSESLVIQATSASWAEGALSTKVFASILKASIMASWNALERMFFLSNQRQRLGQCILRRDPCVLHLPIKSFAAMTRTERHLGTRLKFKARLKFKDICKPKSVLLAGKERVTCFDVSSNLTSLTTISLSKEVDWCWPNLTGSIPVSPWRGCWKHGQQSPVGHIAHSSSKPIGGGLPSRDSRHEATNGLAGWPVILGDSHKSSAQSETSQKCEQQPLQGKLPQSTGLK